MGKLPASPGCGSEVWMVFFVWFFAARKVLGDLRNLI
jgi:hypothetical protein